MPGSTTPAPAGASTPMGWRSVDMTSGSRRARSWWSSMVSDGLAANEVGPVLLCGRVSEAIVAAIRRENAGVRVSHRGSYLRVSAPARCEVHADAVTALLGE